MSNDANEVTLKEAARLAGIRPQKHDPSQPEQDRPANRPGAEAQATLEAMLGASRRGKTLKT
jgi:hypothetical protein